MRALINVLKAAPATYVIDKQAAKFGTAGLHVFDELPQTHPVLDPEAAYAVIAIGVDDGEPVRLCIRGNRGGLIFDRVSLVLGGHADVLCRKLRPLLGG